MTTNVQNELLGEVYTLAEHEENVRRLKSGEITSANANGSAIIAKPAGATSAI